MDVVHEENSVAEAGHGGLHFTALKLAAARADRAFEAVEQSSFVALGLQAADPPGADVRQRFVVEIHGVLCGEQHAQTKGARLLQEDHHRLLRGRHGGGRQVAVDLVHVKEGAERGGALLRTHPAEQLVQQERHEEHAFAIAQMRDVEDGHARLAGLGVIHALYVQRLAFQPRCETGRGDEVVQLHRQRGAFGLGHEAVDIYHAHLADRRLLDVPDEVLQRYVLALFTAMSDDVAHQDMLG